MYEHNLEDILRMKAHTLLPSRSNSWLPLGRWLRTWEHLPHVQQRDLRFPEIKNEKGEMVELTHGRYIQFLESPNPEVREAAFKAMYETYSEWKNTLGATYVAAVKKELYFAKARKYGSSLEAALFADNVAPEVYTNRSVPSMITPPLLHRYVRLRKRLLGLAELHMWISMCPWCRGKMSIFPGKMR